MDKLPIEDKLEILEKFRDSLEYFLNNRRKEQIYYMLAAPLYVAALVIMAVVRKLYVSQFLLLPEPFQKLAAFFPAPVDGTAFWEFDVFQWLILLALSAVIALFFICLSEYLMAQILKSKYFPLRVCAYQEIDHHYYLRPQYVKTRNLFSLISMAVLGLLTVLAVFEFVTPVDVSPANAILICMLTWGRLQEKYYSGSTYEETLDSFNMAETPGTLPVRFLSKLTDSLRPGWLLERSIVHYPVPYSISYPKSPETMHYQILFSSLMQEKNVLIGDAFYQDWGDAFIIPMHRMLLTDRKVVIFSGPTIESSRILEWINGQLSHMFVGEPRWNAILWEEMKNDYDIAVVPFEKIPEFIRNREINFQNIKGLFQVVLEPARITVEIQGYLEAYADFIKRNRIPITYCFADRMMEGLLDQISHVFRCHIEKVEVAADRCGDVFACTVKSNADGERPGLSILLELLRNGAKDIYYISEFHVAVRDMFFAMRNKLTDGNQENEVLIARAASNVHFLRGIWEVKKQEMPYLIVEDEWHHFRDQYRYLSGRGIRFGAIFLLESENNAMQAYLRGKYRLYLDDRENFSVFYPLYQDTDRNRILKLIRYAAKTGSRNYVERQTILECFPNLKQTEPGEITKYLNQLSRKYYKEYIFIRNFEGVTVAKEFLQKKDYLWREVTLVDEERSSRPLGNLLVCQLYQRWLPGQIIARDGCAYEILRGPEPGSKPEVALRRSSQFWDRSAYYYQDIQVCLKNICSETVIGEYEGVIVRRGQTDIKITTIGWYSENNRDRKEYGEQCEIPKREYREKQALFLQMNEENSDQQNNGEEFLKKIAENMQEMCRVLFPLHYGYLQYSYSHLKFRHISKKKGEEKDKLPTLAILEDCEDDLGLLEAIEKRIGEFIRLAKRL